MMVTDIIKPDILYDGDWIGEQYVDINEAIDEYNDKKSRFLFYPWGVFVTSYARRNLYSGILEFGHDYIYSDTDSIKCFNIDNHMNYINRYNAWITRRIDNVLKNYNLDVERSRPKNIKGKMKQIGVWDYETKDSHYTEFKTLGAKRYMYLQDGEIYITISGLSKKMGRDYIKIQKQPFEFFDDEMSIDSEYSGKLTHTYIDDERRGVLHDYLGNDIEYYEKSAVHLDPAEYSLNVLDAFSDFVDRKKKGLTKWMC